MRLALPEANPALSLTASLGITFPQFNNTGPAFPCTVAGRMGWPPEEPDVTPRQHAPVDLESAKPLWRTSDQRNLDSVAHPAWTCPIPAQRNPRRAQRGWDNDGNIRPGDHLQ